MSRKSIQDVVRDYVPGELISQPGIYRNVPMDFYHSQCCIGPSVSSGNIRTAEERNMEHGFEGWSGNPEFEPDEDTTFFGFGRYLHDLAGGADDIESAFDVRPEQWDSWRTKDAKAWRAIRIANKVTCLTPADVAAAHGVIAKLYRHPTIQAGILQGLVEHSIFWIDADTGLWCKARPDVIPVDSGMVVDLKSTTNATFGMCVNAISSHGYHIQMAMIAEGLEVLGFPMEEFVLLFVEKERPYSINHKPVAPWAMEYGRRQLRRTLDKWAECLESGEWTGYEDDQVEAGLSEKVAKMLSKQSEDGLLPQLTPRQPADEEGIG